MVDSLIALPGLVSLAYGRLRRIRRVKALLGSTLLTSIPYLIWDHFAVLQGSWTFSRSNTLGLYWFGMPLEEYLFFLSVPLSSLLIYDVARWVLGNAQIRVPKLLFPASSIALASLGILNVAHSYTSTVLLFTAFILLLTFFLQPHLLSSASFWIFQALSYIPFLAFDHILVTLPAFTYGNGAILGIRVFQIPLEEFAYSFSLLDLYCTLYSFLSSSDSRSRGLGHGRVP
jgi:lycopene cyclase domain-containing protein